jgi:SAM-dependent methyltransferase
MVNSDVLHSYATTNDLATRRGLYDFTIEKPLTDYVIDDLKGFDGMRFCDVGCGYGTDAAAVQNLFPEASVFGIDQSQAMVDAATQLDHRVHFSVGDTLSLPGNEAFDRILVRHVLHLVPNPKESIEYIISRLAPNGRAIFVLHSNTSQPKFTKWITWACKEFGVSYISPSDDFCIENKQQLFDGGQRNIGVKTIKQHIHLSEAEPYVAYMSTQNRWSRPLTEAEMNKLLTHVRENVNATLLEKGVFEEITCNGVVIIDRI